MRPSISCIPLAQTTKSRHFRGQHLKNISSFPISATTASASANQGKKNTQASEIKNVLTQESGALSRTDKARPLTSAGWTDEL